jgi:hypothetical protein
MTNASTSPRMPLYALPISGLLYVSGVLLRGRFASPAVGDPGAFVERTTRDVYPIAYLVLMGAAAAAVLGYAALHERVRGRLGGAAMITSIIGTVFLTAFFGVMALGYPQLGASYAGDPGAIDTAAAIAQSRVTLAVAAMIGVGVIGHVLFAIALWPRGGTVRIASIVFVAAPVMQLIPQVYPVEILGCASFLAASVLFVIADREGASIRAPRPATTTAQV